MDFTVGTSQRDILEEDARSSLVVVQIKRVVHLPVRFVAEILL